MKRSRVLSTLAVAAAALAIGAGIAAPAISASGVGHSRIYTTHNLAGTQARIMK